MKIAVGILFLAVLAALASGQDSPAANHTIAPSFGLQIGEQVPAFALRDQFGHECTNVTLKGSKGTVLLFFRSADW
jgi:cytochrome oxidase Cu insertion factor (SCO1/SenC/PrrC family)